MPKMSISTTSVLVALSSFQVYAQPMANSNARNRFYIPDSVSKETATSLRQLYDTPKQTPAYKKPTKLSDYEAMDAQAKAALGPLSEKIVKSVGAKVSDNNIGGVPVVRIKPANPKTGLEPLVYVHGGGFVALSAQTTTGVPALIATATGREVVSIDYTLAPHADFQKVTDQVISVWRALIEQGQDPGAMGLFGDSAGGNLILSASLKMRDQGVRLPGALYALSPVTDLTFPGDTFDTLGDVDPMLDVRMMPWLLEAYVGKADPKNPYASPVYGDYSKAFPPTLIQGGTREFLLSDFIREYQAIRGGGHEVVLDLYEGMPHVFQAYLPTTHEVKTAITRAASFLEAHLAKR